MTLPAQRLLVLGLVLLLVGAFLSVPAEDPFGKAMSLPWARTAPGRIGRRADHPRHRGRVCDPAAPWQVLPGVLMAACLRSRPIWRQPPLMKG